MTTYMIAFRYMQTKGMKLEFPNALHHTVETEADRLAREYDAKFEDIDVSGFTGKDDKDDKDNKDNKNKEDKNNGLRRDF